MGEKGEHGGKSPLSRKPAGEFLGYHGIAAMYPTRMKASGCEAFALHFFADRII
jgi:hypothetical protein